MIAFLLTFAFFVNLNIFDYSEDKKIKYHHLFFSGIFLGLLIYEIIYSIATKWQY
jgi:hypothetical protein